MIYEKTNIMETHDVDGLEVTLEGVQFTKIIPNETSKERFRNFGDEQLVAVTVKITYKNGSDETVWNHISTSYLDVNNGERRYFNQGMAGNYSPQDLEPGGSGEQYHVFIIEEKYFNLYEQFTIDVGPFYGEGGGELFGGKQATFKLPFE